MRVRMRFVYPGLLDIIPNGIYDFPDGSTVADCVEQCSKQCEAPLNDGWVEKVLFLNDNKPVLKDDIPVDGSELIVVHRIMGG